MLEDDRFAGNCRLPCGLQLLKSDCGDAGCDLRGPSQQALVTSDGDVVIEHIHSQLHLLGLRIEGNSLLSDLANDLEVVLPKVDLLLGLNKA